MSILPTILILACIALSMPGAHNVRCDRARAVLVDYVATTERAAKTRFTDGALLRHLTELVLKDHDGNFIWYNVYRTAKVQECTTSASGEAASVKVSFKLIGKVARDPERPSQQSQFVQKVEDRVVIYTVIESPKEAGRLAIADVTFDGPFYPVFVAIEDFEDRLDSDKANFVQHQRTVALLRQLARQP